MYSCQAGKQSIRSHFDRMLCPIFHRIIMDTAAFTA
jgi:hypothetical protein